MDQTTRIWQLTGTFLPIYGIVLTALAAVIFEKHKRVVALIVIPLVTFWLCTLWGERIAYDGNMLYVTLTLLYSLALCLYYPILLIFGAVYLIKNKQTTPF